MSTSTLRRPVTQLPGELVDRQRPVWPRDALVTAGGGLVFYGGSPAFGLGQYALPVLLATPAVAVGITAYGIRDGHRTALLNSAGQALAPVLGLRRPDARALKATRWKGRGVGRPTRIRLRYGATVDDNAPTWLASVTETVNRRMQATYKVTRHDRRRMRLHLALVPDPVASDTSQMVINRARRTVTQLLGPTAKLQQPQWQGDTLVGFTVTHEQGITVSSAAYRAKTERVMSTMLPDRWRARWDLEADTVRFEVRPLLPKVVAHPLPTITAENLWRIPIALDEDGNIIYWDLKSTAPHILICGRTGTGKTVAINGIVMEAALRDWPVWIVDPKRIEFLGLRRWPNVQVVATVIAEQIAVINAAHALMERRYEMIETGEATEDDFEPLILVLDEFRDFQGAVTDWYASIKVPGMPSVCPVFEKVSSIARKGRSARIHAIIGVQRPDSAWLGGEMRDNFAARLSLGPLSPQGAMMMWEAPHIGVSIPRKTAGRATALSDNDRAVEVQTYWTPDPRRSRRSGNADDLALLEQLRPAQAAHPFLQVRLDPYLMEELDDKGRPMQWKAVMNARMLPVIDDEPQQQLVDESVGGDDAVSAVIPDQATAPVTGRKLSLGKHHAPDDRSRPLRLVTDDTDDAMPDEPDDEAVPSWDDTFGEEEFTSAARVAPGDLLQLDEAADRWVVVESVEVDALDDEEVGIDWRSDDDDAGTYIAAASETVTVRRPLDDVDIDLGAAERLARKGRRR